MVTTIQLGEATVEQLKSMKRRMGAKSYEEVILDLVSKSGKQESLFGFLGDRQRLPAMLRELKQERRTSDRY